MTWGEIANKFGTTSSAARQLAWRYRLNKRQVIEYLEKKRGTPSTIQNGIDYKQKARQVAQRSQADIMHKHHWSYRESDYADTILMSVDDHHTLHRYLVYDSNEKLYRDKSGALLTTKASHVALLLYIKTLV